LIAATAPVGVAGSRPKKPRPRVRVRVEVGLAGVAGIEDFKAISAAGGGGFDGKGDGGSGGGCKEIGAGESVGGGQLREGAGIETVEGVGVDGIRTGSQGLAGSHGTFSEDGAAVGGAVGGGGSRELNFQI